MFSGFAVLRGAELAAVELDSFGIDHPAVSALWVESLGFPQGVADSIKKSTQPLADSDGPLELVLRSACLLAAAVARNDSADVALTTLPASVAAKLAGADGKPDAAFAKLYEALQETEPAL